MAAITSPPEVSNTEIRSVANAPNANGRSRLPLSSHHTRNDTGPTTKPVCPDSQELRALFARIADGACERERDRFPPYAQIRWIKDSGLGRLRIPVKEGGGQVCANCLE
jgi:hypothetical protein